MHCGVCGHRMQGNPNHGENHYRCRYPRDFAPALGMDHPPTVYVRESAIVPKLDEWIATLFAPENLDETCRKLAEAGGASEADHARIGAAQRKLADCDRRLAGYQKTLDAGADPVIVAGWISQVQGERLRAERDLAPAQPSGRLTPKQARARGRLEGHLLRAGRRRPEAQGAALRRAGHHGALRPVDEDRRSPSGSADRVYN